MRRTVHFFGRSVLADSFSKKTVKVLKAVLTSWHMDEIHLCLIMIVGGHLQEDGVFRVNIKLNELNAIWTLMILLVFNGWGFASNL